MQLHIEDYVSDHSSSLRAHAERRIFTVLNRMIDRINRVVVQFSEVGSGVGSSSMRCFILVETSDGKTTAVDDTRGCAFTALDRGLSTVKRMVKCRLSGESHKPGRTR